MEGTGDERQQELAEEKTPSDPIPSEPVGGRARSLLNLRPPWTPGRSGNPSGLAKDGGPAPSAPVRKQLTAQLAKRRALQRMVERWVEDAIEAEDGATRAKARQQILDRLDPITEDSTAGRVVLESIKLELTPGGAALTMARGEGASSSGFVVEETSESRAGG